MQYNINVNKLFRKFKVCKSVHHHKIQINQPTRCNNFSSLLLDVYVQLKCFGSPNAHHQELNNCSSSFWFLPLERGGSSAVGRSRAGYLTGLTTTNSQ